MTLKEITDIIKILLEFKEFFPIIGLVTFFIYLFASARETNKIKLLKTLSQKERANVNNVLFNEFGISKSRLEQMSNIDLERYVVLLIQEKQKKRKHFIVFALLFIFLMSIGLIFQTKNPQPMSTFYQDADGDSYGAPGVMIETASKDIPPGYVSNNLDTDDTDPKRYKIDKIWFYDNDADGFGDDTSRVIAFIKPTNFVSNGQDIDDNDKNRNIQALERDWYEDEDADGFGNLESIRRGIKKPDGYAIQAGDLDDGDENVFPGQALFFATPSRTKGVWDYNCDGISEYQYNQLGLCGEGIASPQGWDPNVPQCGQSMTWLSDCDRKVRGFSLKTIKEYTSKIQSCR